MSNGSRNIENTSESAGRPDLPSDRLAGRKRLATRRFPSYSSDTQKKDRPKAVFPFVVCSAKRHIISRYIAAISSLPQMTGTG